MTHAKIQHYVPKFLLKNFGTGKKDQLWVYDKSTARSFQSNVKNVASESKFYDFEIDNKIYSLESSLSTIESKAKKLIERILTIDSINAWSDDDRGIIAVFLAIQFVRTKAFRAQWASLPGMLRAKVESLKTKATPSSQAEALMRDPTENEIKIDTARITVKAPEDFGPHFLNKAWLLIKTTNSHPFIIGDNPISLQNHTDMEPYGNLGLAVKDIQIYFPLSSTRALAMWCPSLAKSIFDAAESIRTLPKESLVSVKNPAGILDIESALQGRSNLFYNPEHVMNFNSLQIARSERFLFSPKNDFSLVAKMIQDHPYIKSGQRMTAS